MRIALIGYGKMGQLIERLSLQRGHEVVLRITSQNQETFTIESLQPADVAIEFTTPHSAFENVKKCLQAGIPTISGTTGWNKDLPAIKDFCTQHNGTFLHASNFSIGVNLFFEINKRLASLMAHQPNYNVQIIEIHHTQKKDAPSGTAVTLAEQIIEGIGRKKTWTLNAQPTEQEILIQSERIDPAPGTHHVKYSSPIDDIEIIHTAHNREGFATGAIVAAEYIRDKKGIFSMSDVLQ
jgi:4-hydroxy-tetrahydrodipicolinate reductase